MPWGQHLPPGIYTMALAAPVQCELRVCVFGDTHSGRLGPSQTLRPSQTLPSLDVGRMQCGHEQVPRGPLQAVLPLTGSLLGRKKDAGSEPPSLGMIRD